MDEKLLKISVAPPENNGGQQAGMPHRNIVVETLDGSISISCGIHRSQLRNKNLAVSLIELAMEDL